VTPRFFTIDKRAQARREIFAICDQDLVEIRDTTFDCDKERNRLWLSVLGCCCWCCASRDKSSRAASGQQQSMKLRSISQSGRHTSPCGGFFVLPYEVLGNHRRQSQQSRLELGLRISRGYSRANNLDC
jgi:hypothetical protein